jgi:CheY-like chemotaxis protein
MPRVLALVDDLMFLSRIREAARAAGADVGTVRSADALVQGVRDGARLVLVDADSPRLPWREALASLRTEGPHPGVPVVAFFSHVHSDHANAAREAGCDQVVPRGAFVQQLPRLLEGALVPRPPQEESAP